MLARPAVVRAFEDKRVVAMRADWTRRDPAMTAELARHGRNGVPLYLLMAPDGRSPQVLPELLTVDLVLRALESMPAGAR